MPVVDPAQMEGQLLAAVKAAVELVALLQALRLELQILAVVVVVLMVVVDHRPANLEAQELLLLGI